MYLPVGQLNCQPLSVLSVSVLNTRSVEFEVPKMEVGLSPQNWPIATPSYASYAYNVDSTLTGAYKQNRAINLVINTLSTKTHTCFVEL